MFVYTSAMRALFALLSLSLAACSLVGGNDSGQGSGLRPGGDAQGFGGIIVGVDNGRVRCQSQPQSDSVYRVECNVRVVGIDGNEYVPEKIQEGVTLQWNEIVKLEGPDFTKSCTITNQTLTQSCDIRAQSNDVLKLRFDLTLADATSEKIESDIVLLPFSIRSYGFVPQLRSYLQESTASQQGYQITEATPLTTFFGDIRHSCQRNQDIFFSNSNYIFRFRMLENRVELFAGSPNAANSSQSHRLRISLNAATPTKESLYLVCEPQSLIVAEPGGNRILRIHDSGLVETILSANQPRHLIRSRQGGYLFTEIVSGEQLAQKSQIRRLNKDGILSTVATPGQGIVSLVENNRGEIYFAQFTNPSILWKVELDGHLTYVTGCSLYEYRCTSSTPKDFIFYHIAGLALLNDHELLIAEARRRSIRKLNLQTMTIELVAGIGSDKTESSLPPPIPLVGPTSTARFEFTSFDIGANQVQLLSDGSILALSDNRIRKIANQLVTVLVGSGRETFSNVVGQEISPAFDEIHKIYSLPNGEIAIYEHVQERIRIFNPKTAKFRLLNIPPPIDIAIGSDGVLFVLQPFEVLQISSTGELSSISISVPNPKTLTAGPDGSLYIANASGLFVRRTDGSTTQWLTEMYGLKGFTADKDGSFLYFICGQAICRRAGPYSHTERIAGTDARGYLGDGGPALLANFADPASVDVQPNGNIYVLDAGNSRIRVLKPRAVDTLQSIEIGEGTVYSGYLRTIEYDVFSVIGGENGKDCAGTITGKASQDSYSDQLKASLSSLCLGNPKGWAIQDTCDKPGGDIRFYFSQSYNPYSNFVEAKISCSTEFLKGSVLPPLIDPFIYEQ